VTLCCTMGGEQRSITVNVATTGGEVEASVHPGDATVLDLKKSLQDTQGAQFKLLNVEGRELANAERLDDLGDSTGRIVNITRVNMVHPIGLDLLKSVTPVKDPFNQLKFNLEDRGLFSVTLGESKFGPDLYTLITICEPQEQFQRSEALRGYRCGYSYYETFEERDRGDGRIRAFVVHEEEFTGEFRSRLPELQHLVLRVFEDPVRIFKISAFLDKSVFSSTLENLWRFLGVFFEILIDKGASVP